MKEEKHKEQLDSKKIGFINVISFLIGLSTAILAYIISSYLAVPLGTDKVSLFYLLSYAVVLAVLLNLHKVIRRYGKTKVFYIALSIKIFSLLALSILPPSYFSLIFLFSYIISGHADAVCLDVILESFSVDHKSGRIRGMHLMIMDIGFLFGPLLSTQLLENFNFQMVFFAAFFLDSLILTLASLNLKNVSNEFHNKVKVLDLIKKALKHKNIVRIYYISLILEVFYAIMIVFAPVYLRDLGMSWVDIGWVFTVMLIPFTILPYPVGYIADKKLGEKEMLIAAIFIMAMSTMSAFFVTTPDLIVWSTILFMTRIGASMLQTLRDSYFYKRIDGNDVDLIDFFRTAGSMGYIIASIFSFIVLLFYPTGYIFLFLALIALTGLYPAFRLLDNKCEDEISAEKCAVKVKI